MSGRLCIFGEVLFDHFPDGTCVLGGAPFNVAWHLQAFGQSPYFISRVGDDAEGKQVREAMHNWGMDTGGLQTDSRYPTGRVSIQFIDGEPSYDIVEPCAYDAIEPGADDKLGCQLLYHGSLALRDDTTRHTADTLRQHGSALIFVDVNLRPPWWQREQVLEMVDQAHWVKLNADELDQLSPSQADIRQRCQEFIAAHGLSGLVLTQGSEGADVITDQGEHCSVQPDTDINVVDTVGAGDAFASVMILGLNQGWPLELTLLRAQTFASALVGQRGATVSEPVFYRAFINNWDL